MELKELLAEITYEVDAKISNPDFGGFPHEQFLEWCGEQLSEFGEIEAGSLTPSTYEQRGRAIHGFSYSHHDGRLDLFITHYKRAADEYPLYKSDVDASIKRVRNFFERYSQGTDNDIDGDEEAWDLVEIIKRSEIALVRIFLVTDGRTTVKRIDPSEDDLIPIQVHVWDIERFLRNRVSGDLVEDTDVIISDFGIQPIPCSSFDGADSGNAVKTFLCVFPADFLADIYQHHSSRLLERNVRAFLSFRSRVNQGILETLRNEPERFIAYNNGLTVTARELELSADEKSILRIDGLQVVNGGQTTNTIYRAKYMEKLPLGRASVPVKLCVLSDETADEVAPLIAKFANSQNVVKRTDLTSNHPVYRELEKLSRSTLAPAQDGAQVETKWYFERARGQYLDELFKEGSPANKKKFENRFPRNQKFDKGHLAKCWGIWHQQVQDVSLGNEKYHVEFIDDLDKNINKFDLKRPEASYRRLISLIIIRNHVYKKIRGEKLGYSFPGNVTDYTIALISQLCSMQFDLETVWKFQRPQAEFMANVDRLAPVVANTIKELCEQHGVIANELAKGRRVAGGKTLWTILKEMSLSLEPELPTAGDGPTDPSEGTGTGVPTPDVSKEIQAVVAAGEQRLWDVVMWSKDTGNLQPWQRQITASVAKLLQKGREPSQKQAVQVIRALGEANELGFKPTDEV